MLRNPIDVVCSLHSQYLFDGNESDKRLDEARGLAADRLKGGSIPPGSHFPAGLQYLDVVDFHTRVERYIEEFGRERVYVILLEEFSADNRTEYERVLRFLEVGTTEMPSFRKVNRNKYARSRILRDVLKRPPASFKVAGRLLPRRLRTEIRKNLLSLNRVESERLPVGGQLRERLISELEPGLDALGELLEVDVRSVWAI